MVLVDEDGNLPRVIQPPPARFKLVYQRSAYNLFFGAFAPQRSLTQYSMARGGVQHFFELEAITRGWFLSCDPESSLVDDFKIGCTVWVSATCAVKLPSAVCDRARLTHRRFCCAAFGELYREPFYSRVNSHGADPPGGRSSIPGSPAGSAVL